MNKLKIVVNAHINGDPRQAYQDAISRIETQLGQLMGKSPGTYFTPLPLRPPPKLSSNFSREDFEKAVLTAQEYIHSGDILQVVLSQRFHTEVNYPPLNIYRALRTINPSPYMFYLKFDDLYLIV